MCDVTCALDGFIKVDLYRWSCTCYVIVKVVPLIEEHVFNYLDTLYMYMWIEVCFFFYFLCCRSLWILKQ